MRQKIPLRYVFSSIHLLVILTVRTEHGEAAFSCYAAQLWNQLPDDIKGAPTVASFKSKPKTCSVLCSQMLFIYIYQHLSIYSELNSHKEVVYASYILWKYYTMHHFISCQKRVHLPNVSHTAGKNLKLNFTILSSMAQLWAVCSSHSYHQHTSSDLKSCQNNVKL